MRVAVDSCLSARVRKEETTVGPAADVGRSLPGGEVQVLWVQRRPREIRVAAHELRLGIAALIAGDVSLISKSIYVTRTGGSGGPDTTRKPRRNKELRLPDFTVFRPFYKGLVPV